MILTSNQSFGSWGDVFGDRIIATAILDRVLHHAITINIRGNSYRLKDKLKAGLVKPVEATTCRRLERPVFVVADTREPDPFDDGLGSFADDLSVRSCGFSLRRRAE